MIRIITSLVAVMMPFIAMTFITTWDIMLDNGNVISLDGLPSDNCSNRQDERMSLEFIHIPKTGGTSIEIAAARAGIAWGYCKFHRNGLCSPPAVPSNNTDSSLPEQLSLLKPPLKKVDWTCTIGVPKPKKKTNVDPWHCPPNHFHLQMNTLYNDLDNNGTIKSNPYHPAANTFAIVRNPYHRMISDYYFIHSWTPQHQQYDTPEYMNRWIQEQVDLVKKTGVCALGHCIPMHKYTHDYRNTKEEYETVESPKAQNIDHILHLENITHELPHLLQQYGEPYRRLPLRQVEKNY